MTFAEGGPGWVLVFDESTDNLMNFLDISNYDRPVEVWHVNHEIETEDYNPLTEFLFERIG